MIKCSFILILFLVFFSCKEKKNNEDIISDYVNNLGLFENSPNVTLFLIPVEINCQSCVKKLMERYIESLKKDYKLVLISGNNLKINQFIHEYNLQEGTYFLDDSDFLLKNGVMLLNPVIVERSHLKINSQIIYPINSKDLLDKYFANSLDCTTIINQELKDLEFIGEIVSLDYEEDSIRLSVKDLGKDVLNHHMVSKRASEYFNGKLEIGVIMKKSAESKVFYEFIPKNDESATIITHQFSCE